MNLTDFGEWPLWAWQCIFAEQFENCTFSQPSYAHSLEEELGGISKEGGNFLPVLSWDIDEPSRHWTCSWLLLTWDLGSFPLRHVSTQILHSSYLMLIFTWDKHLTWKATSPPFLYIKHQGFLPCQGYRISGLSSYIVLQFLASTTFPSGQSQDHCFLWQCDDLTLQIHSIWAFL